MESVLPFCLPVGSVGGVWNASHAATHVPLCGETSHHTHEFPMIDLIGGDYLKNYHRKLSCGKRHLTRNRSKGCRLGLSK